MQPNILVSTFYHFSPLQSPATLKAPLHERMLELGIRGTLTLATEGVNATISGMPDAMERFMETLRSLCGLPANLGRDSYFTHQPFARSKVKVKHELISLGRPAHPTVCVGTYVPPHEWNSLITRPGLTLIDTRNDHEYAMGHFRGALNPRTCNFKQMVAFTEQHLKPGSGQQIAMYCTGGIRCDKYSAYLLSQGFEEVYHLKGGILAYLEQIPPAESLWEGYCFVFDERVALGHGLAPAAVAL